MQTAIATYLRTASVENSWEMLTECFRTLRTRYQHRMAARELQAMDEHLLRDIGLGRGEIERAVRLGRF